MQTKLHINISQGAVDFEGDPELVREVYADFRDKLLNGMTFQKAPQLQETEKSDEEPKQKPKRRVKAKLRGDRQEAVGPNDVWAMDFAHDQLALGKKLRTSKNLAILPAA